ncbi:Polysaccharide deacetylase [Roseivivax jejudonensis]|uniref:Chitooligosaccharide deacetylase n=1 Tax=Roseivivax jejudonensis TaxID=1529041 RepID=A0A1X6Y5T6_9RHOB|nr:polysaccharide deacetylase family protein [Roseivivax jejudonensis]SLN11568.1 Polysaccharide deacetylase [Roseivivax jejudonensis]
MTTAMPLGFAETEAQAYPRRPPQARLRAAAKSAVLHCAPWLRRPAPRFVRCLYAHAIFPEQRSIFADTLAALRTRGDIIDSATLSELIADGTPPDGRYFHLSFDDGFANVVENGAESLDAAGVPATIFVCSGFPDAAPARLRDWFQGMSAYARPVRPMNWDQIRAFHAAGGEIGVHTRSHARLSMLEHDTKALQAEIAGAKSEIEERICAPCTTFAWPFGRASDIGPRGRQAVAAAGFQLAFSAVRGCVRPGTDPMDVPRHQIEFHWPRGDLRAWIDGFGE